MSKTIAMDQIVKEVEDMMGWSDVYEMDQEHWDANGGRAGCFRAEVEIMTWAYQDDGYRITEKPGDQKLINNIAATM